VGSETITPAELTQRLQTLVTLRAAVNAAKATTKANLVTEASQTTPIVGLMTEFSAYLRVIYSKSPDVLADFGLKPRKPNTPLTVQAKAAAAAKRKATRAARHTMGKVQKQDVLGDVVGVTVTPVIAPKPVAASSAPAASAPAPGPAPTVGGGGGASASVGSSTHGA
jgi:hypothetical protein